MVGGPDARIQSRWHAVARKGVIMVDVRRLASRGVIEEFLRRDTAMHVYPLADLDDPYWAQTSWYATGPADDPEAICLLFDGLALPIVYAVAPAGHAATARLLAALAPRLPDRLEASVALGDEEQLASEFRFLEVREQLKMVLACPQRIPVSTCAGCDLLSAADLAELQRFYTDDAYAPGEEGGRFFNQTMLAAGPYFGIRESGRLVAAGGVHVLSPSYGVAALGNVATSPAARGRGLATQITAAVCRELLTRVQTIGLNVGADNLPARRLYAGLGFQPVCRYLEIACERRATGAPASDVGAGADQSAARARTGSTRVARNAGNRHAAAATSRSRTTTVAIVTGSFAPTP